MYYKKDKQSKFFMENIRSFNSFIAFTSMGAKIDTTLNKGGAPPTFVMNGENYHQICSLLPQPDKDLKFSQLYVYDTDNEFKNRMRVVRYCFLSTNIVLFLLFCNFSFIVMV